MAAADKTYINKDQYILVKEWWLKTRKKQIRELGNEIYMYPFQYLEHITYENGYDNPTIHYKYDPSESNLDIENMGDDSPVWNTSTKINFWIAKNCPLDFIQEQIREKLSEEFYQEIPEDLKPLSLIDKMDFSVPDQVLQITGKDTYLYFWEKDGEKYKSIDKMLVYGTTFLYKLIHNFQNSTYSKVVFPYKVIFTYCGLNFEYFKSRMYYLPEEGKKKEIHIPFFNFKDLKLPKFKHSWKVKDCENTSPGRVLLSMEDKVYDLKQYKSGSTNKRLLMELPNYIYEQLK